MSPLNEAKAPTESWPAFHPLGFVAIVTLPFLYGAFALLGSGTYPPWQPWSIDHRVETGLELVTANFTFVSEMLLPMMLALPVTVPVRLMSPIGVVQS